MILPGILATAPRGLLDIAKLARLISRIYGDNAEAMEELSISQPGSYTDFFIASS